MLRQWSPWLGLCTALLMFTLAVAQLRSMPAQFVNLEMVTAMPRFVQVALSGGDRYLAANIVVFRALTLSQEQPSPETIHVQGQIQADAAWLNPAHEDNYYVAAATLPWNNEFEAGDYVLSRATEGRPFDFIPPFFRGFNHFYFRHDPRSGASYVKLAAERADSDNRQAFETIAARWMEKGSEPEEAVRILTGMQQTSRSTSVKRYIEERIVSLKKLIALRTAADKYRNRTGHAPRQLSDLVKSGDMNKLPANPAGRAYVLNQEGIPVLINLPPASQVKK